MRNLLVTLKYDGSNYHGWQIQQNASTVQEVVSDAVRRIIGENAVIHGCSRTDTGVHANMFCLNFKTLTKLSCEDIVSALNGNLPFDIAAIDCKEVPDDFHARFSCKSKEYVYKIVASPVRDPFLLNYALHYKYPLNLDLMNEACKYVIGQHDFSSFCSAGSSVASTIRTVYNAEFSKEGNLVVFRISGDGFLYNMVRIIVGTMLYISQGKISPNDIEKIIESKDRNTAGPTAPAKGLYLNMVCY